MSTITTTVPAYAESLNISRQALLRRLKEWERGKDKAHLLPDVLEFKKVGRDYLLTIRLSLPSRKKAAS
jgi:DNA-binding Lrp family transcriptional regulator